MLLFWMMPNPSFQIICSTPLQVNILGFSIIGVLLVPFARSLYIWQTY
ncbi:hypothetical protein NC653_041315 [Populus alba x Populus x berolinensis]|uniref:Uncharacterized protein n=1 Tax=Populus alba x Populus x berolinensis TaxID=444605 RepID=A0AAD6PPS3_9ROSI|nr:hypothetical protein NC653_041315 [Populus alba x Populus x berolinensis]